MLFHLYFHWNWYYEGWKEDGTCCQLDHSWLCCKSLSACLATAIHNTGCRFKPLTRDKLRNESFIYYEHILIMYVFKLLRSIQGWQQLLLWSLFPLSFPKDQIFPTFHKVIDHCMHHNPDYYLKIKYSSVNMECWRVINENHMHNMACSDSQKNLGI